MPKGFFRVSPINSSGIESIDFATLAESGEPPDNQLQLKSDVEQTLHGLQAIYNDRKVDYKRFYDALLSLAQCGLVGEYAQPKVASLALVQLRNEVIALEAHKVKNEYLKRLGLTALALGLPCAILGAIIDGFLGHNFISNFLFVWASCMAGVWVSFAARKITLTFEELETPERDMLRPLLRLLFAGILTLMISMVLISKMVDVTIGGFSSSRLTTDVVVAIIVGSLCGFSELVLPSKLFKQAKLFLDQQ